MNKKLKVGSIVLGVMVLASLTIGGVVLADDVKGAVDGSKIYGQRGEGECDNPDCDGDCEENRFAQMHGGVGKRMKDGHFGGNGEHLAVMSEILGLNPEEIKVQLEEGKTMVEIAEAQGFGMGELKDSIFAAMTGWLQQEIEDGTISQKNADRLLEQMEEMYAGRESGFHPIKMAGQIDLITDVLGLSLGEIKEQFEEGKTMIEIVEAQGFDLEALKDSISATMTDWLQQEVEDGTISQEQADLFLERMQERVENGATGGRMGHRGFNKD